MHVWTRIPFACIVNHPRPSVGAKRASRRKKAARMHSHADRYRSLWPVGLRGALVFRLVRTSRLYGAVGALRPIWAIGVIGIFQLV